MMAKDNYGKPLFKKLKYCTRCCMPETTEGITFDEMGICQICRSSEEKMHINWEDREKKLRETLEFYKKQSGTNYDCMVPISGGKDSIFQLHVLIKEYGIKPLTVTFSHNWFTETGKRNLQTCIDKLGVDNITFTPSRPLVNKLARQSLYKIGDSCWHCHIGVESFPLQVAVKWGIPLMVYGESLAEISGRASYNDNPEFDYEYFLKHSARVRADEMISDNITAKDVYPFNYPSIEELDKAKIVRIFLGDYMFWDLEKQTELMKKEYGWEEDYVEGTYKRYKSVECKMPGVHDYAKFIKRGFGRGTDFASVDVRSGLLTREEGFELAKQFDSERPGVLDYYLDITGLTEEEFLNILKEKREGKANQLPDIKRAGDID